MALPKPVDPSGSEEALALALVKAYRDAATADEKATARVMLAKLVHLRPLAQRLGMIAVCRGAMSKMGWGKLKQDPEYLQLLELAPDEKG